MPTMTKADALADKITRKLIDDGKLIEGGFAAYALMTIPPDAPLAQVNECRLAFMAGAEHVFNSIMSTLDPGAEPTEQDLRRMTLIDSELREWRRKLAARVGLPPEPAPRANS